MSVHSSGESNSTSSFDEDGDVRCGTSDSNNATPMRCSVYKTFPRKPDPLHNLTQKGPIKKKKLEGVCWLRLVYGEGATAPFGTISSRSSRAVLRARAGSAAWRKFTTDLGAVPEKGATRDRRDRTSLTAPYPAPSRESDLSLSAAALAPEGCCLSPTPTITMTAGVERRPIALGIRTNGDNSIDNQGSDGARVETIGISDGQTRTVLPYNEESNLEAMLLQLEHLSGPGALLICRGETELRQVLHPLCVRENVIPGPMFFEFINMSKIDATPLPDALELELLSLLERFSNCTEDQLIAATEKITVGAEQGVCSKDEHIEGEVVVRARGLPWQASDNHVAQFFAGLNIAPAGVALCLSSEGRRNGEALVRFTTPEMRVLALKRHRHFLLSRYIEVYRASGEEFLQVAAGCSSEAMWFVSRGAAVIVRMRGLPYDCTDQQIKEFFHAEPNSCEVMEQGVMFVTRPDGRPTGDAFVQFADEESGTKSLTKHRQSIGARYIELFRSTVAEVNQVMKRSAEQNPPAAVRRDCVRLRGLPYEARVEHVVDFLGDHSRNIVFQGVHMVFNAQGHPSGEAFIQMNSEQAASAAAAGAHNKFMTIGKKQRYIEVFQCSPEDMHLVIAAPQQQTAVSAAQPLVMPQVQQRLPAGFAAAPSAMPLPFGAMYWPYPSPPVSPNMMLATGGQILVTGVGLGVTPQDIANQFTTQDSLVESVQMLRWPSTAATGEALVRLRPLGDVSSATSAAAAMSAAPLMIDPSQLAVAAAAGLPSMGPLYPLIHT